MVDVSVLGTDVERRVGSSPTKGKIINLSIINNIFLLFFKIIKKLTIKLITSLYYIDNKTSINF